MPAYAWVLRFRRDSEALTPDQQAAFLVAVKKLVEDLGAGRQARKGLRVKGIKGASGIYEMTWAPDGRATFQFGPPIRGSEVHTIWRRVGAHAILNEA